MLKDKDKIVALAIGKLKKDKGMEGETPAEPEGDEDTGMMGKEAAAEAILRAMKSGSPSSLASALSSFVSMCGEREEYEDEE
jgi:hypothetical protein